MARSMALIITINMLNLVDFHTHVLPGIDDGSKNPDQSIQMLKQLESQNISSVVATPHFYTHKISANDFLQARNNSLQALLNELDEKNLKLNLQLFIGAELAYYDNIGSNDELENFCIQGTKTLMLELPLCKFDNRIFNEIYAISSQGITPVIAHCERYLKFKNNISIYQNLIDSGAKIQANSNFFIDVLTKNKAMKLLKNDFIHVLGSDCHDLINRKPNLDLALQNINKKKLSQCIEQINFNTNELLKGANDYIKAR